MDKKRIRISKPELSNHLWRDILTYLTIFEKYRLGLCSQRFYRLYKEYDYKEPINVYLGYFDTLYDLLKQMPDENALYNVSINKFGAWIRNKHLKEIFKYNIFRLRLQGCIYVDGTELFKNLHTLVVSSCSNVISKPIDLENLKNIHTLRITAHTKLPHLGLIKNIHTLDLCSVHIVNLDGAENINTINLRDCYEIKHFDKLFKGKIKRLELVYMCSNHPKHNVDALRRSGTIVEELY
jgi:hypothetical protein